MGSGRSDPVAFVQDAGIKVAIGATTVEITSLTAGERYRLSAQGGGAAVRIGADDASSANGGFDFAVLNGESVYVRGLGTTINVIELDATSDAAAALYIQRVSSD